METSETKILKNDVTPLYSIDPPDFSNIILLSSDGLQIKCDKVSLSRMSPVFKAALVKDLEVKEIPLNYDAETISSVLWFAVERQETKIKMCLSLMEKILVFVHAYQTPDMNDFCETWFLTFELSAIDIPACASLSNTCGRIKNEKLNQLCASKIREHRIEVLKQLATGIHTPAIVSSLINCIAGEEAFVFYHRQWEQQWVCTLRERWEALGHLPSFVKNDVVLRFADYVKPLGIL